jgi:hypothetical protein
MVQIQDIRPSNAQGKRYVALMDDGKRFHFGLSNPRIGTYIDHKDQTLRKNYLARHLANNKERQLIESLTPSAALFSAYLLWSYPDEKITTLEENVALLNRLFKNHGK